MAAAVVDFVRAWQREGRRLCWALSDGVAGRELFASLGSTGVAELGFDFLTPDGDEERAGIVAFSVADAARFAPPDNDFRRG